MNDFGHFASCLAWLLAITGLSAGVYSGVTKKAAWCQTARNATILGSICVFLAIFSLGYGFATNDYTNQYIWQFSNRDMPAIYKVSAIWGGMDGSMLLWCFILSISAGILAYKAPSYPRSMQPWLLAVVNSSALFFLTVTVFLTNPFQYLDAPFIPPDGNGLNPILQNPFMAIHPPMLYAGFTTFAIPYAFCMAALLSGNLGNEWLRLTRRWTLVAWGFLTAGIVLGGYWAYIELGWGGFWAWDPVENASFLPWLTGTAFLHSVLVQERKNMLKLWNVWLIVATYALIVFGTFLTRSGIVQSVHAFASTDVGWVFLVYIGLIVLLAAGLSIYRRKLLESEKKIESFLSREAAFLVNNLIFLSICFATLWGVMFPVLSEALTGSKQAVGVPFFNAVNVPIFLFMVLMMGIGPLIAWRKATLSSLIKTFLMPFASAFVVAVILLWAGVTAFYPLLAYALSFFVLMTIMMEFHKGVKTQKVSGGEKRQSTGKSIMHLFRRHRSRYAGHVIHLGVLVMVVAITASMAYKVEREFSLGLGETYEIGRFGIELQEVKQRTASNYESLYALAAVKSLRTGEILSYLRPELRFYSRNQETTTEVAIRKSVREDVYLVLAGLDQTGEGASMKVYINPLQSWLWFGALIVMFGTLILLLPQKKRKEISRKSKTVVSAGRA